MSTGRYGRDGPTSARSSSVRCMVSVAGGGQDGEPAVGEEVEHLGCVVWADSSAGRATVLPDDSPNVVELRRSPVSAW